MKYLTLAAPFAFALGIAPAAASPINLAELDAAVAQFTGVPLGRPGGAAQPVDRRLRLAACTREPTLQWHSGRREAVLVQCPDPGGWRVFVPVLQAAAGADAVLRGETVTVMVGGAGFSVSQAGEAIESGAVGAWIRVRPASGAAQPLRARVVRPGLVRLDLGDSETGSPLP
ncbi:MAG: flagella basal body P-ring formation protein FlgA [Pseudomonadota bacterium]